MATNWVWLGSRRIANFGFVQVRIRIRMGRLFFFLVLAHPITTTHHNPWHAEIVLDSWPHQFSLPTLAIASVLLSRFLGIAVRCCPCPINLTRDSRVASLTASGRDYCLLGSDGAGCKRKLGHGTCSFHASIQSPPSAPRQERLRETLISFHLTRDAA